MEVFALSGLINGIIALTISILVFARNHKSIANKTFSLFALAVAIWSFGFWRWLLAPDNQSALFWIKLFTLPSILIPALYFHWIILLLEISDKKFFKRFLYFLYGFSAILIPLLFPTDLLIQGVTQRMFFPYWPVPGNLYLFFVFIYSAVVISSLLLLFKNSKGLADNEKRKQRLFVFWGTLIGFGGGATTFFLWYEIPIPPYGNFLVAIGLFLWGYAAAQYHLFNIRAIIAEVSTFTIWIAVLVEFLMADSWQDRLVGTGLLAIVIVLGITIIRSVRKEVEQREKLEKLTKELESTNKDLEAANEKLRQLDKLKSEFLSFASHQVKAPMSIIKGYASLIREGSFGKIPKKVKETVLRIEEVVDRTVRLVCNFLDLSKIEEGKMKYQFTEVDIVALVKAIVDELKIMAQNKSLDLSSKLPSTPVRIKADEENLRQVILNLVENSIKYTEKGFVNVELKTEKSSVLISVSDSGYGISQELLPNLFKRFFRDSKTAKQIRGTGLGLYIAKEIITAHHGKIWAESEGEGKGARFYVKLPPT